MAVSKFYVRSIGECWALLVQDWLQYVPDTDATFAITVGFVAPNIAVIATKAGGLDPWTHTYLILEMTNGSTVGPAGYLNSPGWRTMPPLQPSAYGSRDVLTDWRATMITFRMTTWPVAMGVTIGTVQQTTLNHGAALWSTSLDLAIASKSGIIGVELSAVGIRNAGYTAAGLSPNLPTDCILAGPGSQPMTTGGGSVDISALVQPLQDIARRDMTISIDNGETLIHAFGTELL